MKKQEKNKNGLKAVACTAAIALLGAGGYAVYKGINSKVKDPIVIVNPSPDDDESDGDPSDPIILKPNPTTPEVPDEPTEPTIPVTPPADPTTPSDPTPPVTPPTDPIPPVTPTEPTPSKWDLFDPTSAEERQPIIDKIIEQLKADPVTYRNPSPYIMRDVIYVLNGVKFENQDRIIQTFGPLDSMINSTTCVGSIIEFIETGENHEDQINISIEDMMASKESHDYLERYFASKQPIYDAIYQSKNRNLMLTELAKFTDYYYDVFTNREKFLGEKRFQDLPIEVKFIILKDFLNMNGFVNYADYAGILPKDIQIRYDFKTKLNKVDELLRVVFSAMKQRAVNGISYQERQSLTASTVESDNLAGKDYIRLTATQYVKKISFRNLKFN
jgi:hypothetical protein